MLLLFCTLLFHTLHCTKYCNTFFYHWNYLYPMNSILYLTLLHTLSYSSPLSSEAQPYYNKNGLYAVLHTPFYIIFNAVPCTTLRNLPSTYITLSFYFAFSVKSFWKSDIAPPGVLSVLLQTVNIWHGNPILLQCAIKHLVLQSLLDRTKIVFLEVNVVLAMVVF